MSRTRIHCAFLVIALCLPGVHVEAAVFRVGSDAACTHADIQSAIDAAAANGADTLDSIRIARNDSYLSQALVIDSQRVILVGGYADCSANTRGLPLTVVDGDGNGGHPILTIRSPGSIRQLVQIAGLELRGGNAQTGDGGALLVTGNAQVDLSGISLHDNKAGRGGAIYARGNSSTEKLDLSLGRDSITGEPFRAEDNLADLGGAVFVDANAKLTAGDARIAQNHAMSGGGIYLGSGGEGFFAFNSGAAVPLDRGVQSNTAELDGGGIYIASGLLHYVERYSPMSSYRISGNEAGRDGGGVFVTGAGSFLFAVGLRLDDNRAGALQAGRGGGGYADNGGGILVRGDSIGGSVNYCPAGAPCASVSGNQAGINGHAGQGGGLYAGPNGHATFFVGELRGNQSGQGSAGMAAGTNATLKVWSALVVGNVGNAGTIQASSAASLDLQGITLTNVLGSGPLLGIADAQMLLTDSIVHQPGRMAASVTGTSTVSTDCVISHENFDASGDVRVIDPGFMDAGNGDYRLRIDSGAIDACSQSNYLNRDVRDEPRGVDLPEIPNIGGAYDAGAFERQTGETVFADGFDPPAT